MQQYNMIFHAAAEKTEFDIALLIVGHSFIKFLRFAYAAYIIEENASG